MKRHFGRGTSLLRGQQLTMVVNHWNKSWDDPPSTSGWTLDILNPKKMDDFQYKTWSKSFAPFFWHPSCESTHFPTPISDPKLEGKRPAIQSLATIPKQRSFGFDIYFLYFVYTHRYSPVSLNGHPHVGTPATPCCQVSLERTRSTQHCRCPWPKESADITSMETIPWWPATVVMILNGMY